LAISLLSLIILHYAGYYFIFVALENQHESDWQARLIRNDFNSESLQSASIPISFPYQVDQIEYQIVDESIELEGKHYRIIKKRYAQDTLHIVYVNDHKSEKIQNDLKDWANQLAQNDQNSQNKDTQNYIRMVDYQYLLPDYVFHPIVSNDKEKSNHELNSRVFNQVFISIPSPPPKS